MRFALAVTLLAGVVPSPAMSQNFAPGFVGLDLSLIPDKDTQFILQNAATGKCLMAQRQGKYPTFTWYAQQGDCVNLFQPGWEYDASTDDFLFVYDAGENSVIPVHFNTRVLNARGGWIWTDMVPQEQPTATPWTSTPTFMLKTSDGSEKCVKAQDDGWVAAADCDESDLHFKFGMRIFPNPAAPTSPAPAPTSSAPTSSAPSSTPSMAPSDSLVIMNDTPPPPPPALKGSSHGDPHFTTWSGHKYDFHGGCDLVLVDNPGFGHGLGLKIHIRTKTEVWWSFIEAAVIQLGDQRLELMGGLTGEGPQYWVNGLPGEEDVVKDLTLKGFEDALKEHVEGFAVHYKRVSDKQHRFRIDLNKQGDAISMETYKHWVAVNVKAQNPESFAAARGLMGQYPSGAMVGRNGTKVVEANAFGKDWQVTNDEPMLFHSVEGPQYPEGCVMPNSDQTTPIRRRLGETLVTKEDASIACAHASDDNMDACIFDVLATNDKDMAGAY